MQLPKTQFTTKQIVFIAIAAVLAITVILVLFKVLPGRRTSPSIRTLEVWGVDGSRVWANTIRNFQSVYPDVAVGYKSIDEEDYEETLINALAAGKGPDVFMFENNWLLKHGNKIIPVSSDKFSISTLQSLFPQVIEKDFVASGRIFSLPLSIDTLALAYNRDLFDQGGIVFAPKTWTELIAQIEDLRTVGEDGRLTKAAFALGGSSESVPNSTERVRAMHIQNGVSVLSSNSNKANFSNRDGRKVFEQYLAFINPNSSRYSWDESFRNANEAFARSEVAGIFVFAKELEDITDRNAFLDVEVAPLPQIDSELVVNVADYWGLAVSSEANDSNLAWDFIIFATTDQNTAKDYILTTGNPPALRFLIDLYKDSSSLGIFTNQALTARSELQPSDEQLTEAFDEAIKSILESKLTISQGVSRAADIVNNLLR